ncbi:MAG: hypothetical protein FK734_08275 [Asgard group archaeon]|nr:hypothetical protein [Asgard group archaeon]
MTGQFHDLMHFQNELYELVGSEAGNLYNPKDHGLDPQFRCTACRRGYLLTYKVTDKQLILDDILINLEEKTKINGVKPKTPEEKGSPFQYQYKNVNLKIDFTGKLLLGKDFVRGMYEHMGFQQPMTYKKVLELTFNKGILESTTDLSKAMDEERKSKKKTKD